MDSFELIVSPINTESVKIENYEEVKSYVTDRIGTYENAYYSEEQKGLAKEDRAKLNKFKNNVSKLRISKKKEYLEAFNDFETKMKELESLADKGIGRIDEQLDTLEEKRKAEKQKAIEELFETIGFQNFVTLDKIQDPKWLNATTSMKSIEEQMRSRMYEIGNGVLRISQFPEFSFEAMETYKETLLIDDALDTVQKERQMAQKKAAAKAEEERRAQEQQRAAMAQVMTPPEAETEVQPPQADESKKFPVKFEAILTKEQAEELGAWFAERNITFRAIM